MKQLNAYLGFNGNCEEALRFYKDAFSGEYNIMRFSDTPQDGSYKTPPGYDNKVMHARFDGDGFFFMASDGMPGHEVKSGDQVNLNLDFSDMTDQERVFNKLSEGGNVIMPLADTFWGAKFGMLVDRFGISWMLNFTKEEPKQ